MRGNFAAAFFLCFVATTGFAQSRLNGKWATDRPADPLTITDAQRKQSVQLELTTEDAKASGTLAFGGLGGTFYTFENGKVTGNKVQLRIDPRPTAPTWTIEMVDDNTVMLYRGEFPLIGNNVLDLISVPGGLGQPGPAVQIAAVTPGATFAAGATGSISGIVLDPTKARIPGVTVTATNVDNGAESKTITNDAGLYGFPSVIPGRYTMTAILPGFNTTTVSNLSIGDTQFLQDFTLELRTVPNPTAASCAPNGIVVWCSVLHRRTK